MGQAPGRLSVIFLPKRGFTRAVCLLSVIFFLPGLVYADSSPSREQLPASYSLNSIEVFDPSLGQVIKRLLAAPIDLKQAERFLQAIGDLDGKARLDFPKQGMIIKIQFAEPRPINHPSLGGHRQIAEIYIFFDNVEGGKMMLLTTKNEPFLVRLTDDPRPFIQRLAASPKEKTTPDKHAAAR